MHDLNSVAPEILDAADDSVSAALSIPDDVRDDLAGIATEVRQQRVACVESAIEIGRLLKDARGRLSKRGNGIFKKWVEAECGLAETTAKRFMRAFRVFGERGQILVDTGHRVDLLYLHAKKQIFPGIFISVERIFSNGVFRVSIEEKSPSPEGTRC